MDQINQLIETSHSLWREGRESAMLPYLYKAIQICKQTGNIKKQIEILNEYAGALRINGHYKKAQEQIDIALSLIEEHYGSSNISFATTLMNKANISREEKDYFLAEQLMLTSKALFDYLEDRSYSYIGLLNNYSLLCQEVQNFSKAEELQLEAISLLRENEKYKVPLAISYNNLYEIQKKLGKFENALEYLLLAKDLLLQEVGETHPLYSAILNNLAELYVNKKEYHQALSLYEQALEVVSSCYGKESSAYQSVSSNLKYLKDLMQTLEIKKKEVKSKPIDDKDTSYQKGLIRAKKLASQIRSFLQKEIPELDSRICLALVGAGSECLGYDDSISADHDNNTRCLVLLDNIDFKKYQALLKKLFKEKFLNTQIDIQNIYAFYTYYTSYPEGPQNIEEFFHVPEEYLCSATNGEVFYDGLGLFSQIRNQLLQYYPDDFRYKKLSFHLNYIAQSGQYNYPRILQRKDYVAAELALAEYMKHYISVIYLLNSQYMPFYKWANKGLEKLSILGKETQESLSKLILTDFNGRISIIEDMVQALIVQLHQLELTKSNVDFLIYQATEIHQKIIDTNLKKIDPWSMKGFTYERDT